MQTPAADAKSSSTSPSENDSTAAIVTPSVTPSTPTALDAFAVNAMRATLHAAGKATAGMTDGELAAAYDVHREEQRRALQERAARAHARQLERAAEAAERARKERVARCRRELLNCGEDVARLTDDQAMARLALLTAARRREEEELRRRQVAEALFRRAGCPEKHVARLDQIDPTNREWLRIRDMLAERARDGYLVALLGIRGPGKTQLAVSVIHRACERGLSCRYVKALDLFRLIRATYNAKGRDGEREEDVVDALVRVRVLVIDEVHQRGGTEFEDNLLTNVLDRRYDADRATILIANQSAKDFAATIGSSAVSRIHETGEAITCDWPSYRREGMWRDSRISPDGGMGKDGGG